MDLHEKVGFRFYYLLGVILSDWITNGRVLLDLLGLNCCPEHLVTLASLQSSVFW